MIQNSDAKWPYQLSSVKRGVEGMVALALSHGEDVDWEKVSSSHARRPEEMKECFSKAKKYAPNLVSLILPAPTPATAAPLSSAPPAPDSTPSEVSYFSFLLCQIVLCIKYSAFCCNRNIPEV
jgi:hypothetical protein